MKKRPASGMSLELISGLCMAYEHIKKRIKGLHIVVNHQLLPQGKHENGVI